MEVVFVQAESLKKYCSLLFQKLQVPEAEAIINADNLVEADLSGVESHGVSGFMAIFAKRIRLGQTRPVLELKTEREGLSSGFYDGCNSLGASIANKMMEVVIEKAGKTGVAFATVKNSNHYGMAGYWAQMALPHNMIGFTGAIAKARVAPWGGTVPCFGTNPCAFAVPAGKQFPIVIDMATAAVARSKIRLAAERNEPIPLGWALSADGSATTDAKAAMAGALLPFGGAKGSAIALLVEILGGILAGGVFSTASNDMILDFTKPANISHYFGAINVGAFAPVDKFKNDIDQLIVDMKNNPPAQGFDQVRIPGERRWRTREKRLREGIPLKQTVIEVLRKEGKECGLEYFPEVRK